MCLCYLNANILNPLILTSDVQQFLTENANESPSKIALKKSPFQDVSAAQLAEQVDTRQRLKSKLSHWIAADNIYFPPKRNAEQCSSEQAALYKASLVEGQSAIDLTGGFGVDVWAFSQRFDHLTYCELNDDLFPIVKHNFSSLGCDNVTCYSGDGLVALTSQEKWDLIYLDPARRDEHNRKMVSFSSCVPNVVEHQELLYNHADTIMIKASPMMDISLALEELQGVKAIHVVAVKNECKELLFLLEKGFEGEADIHCVNLSHDKADTFTFKRSEESSAFSELSHVGAYLYEPNTTILKAGAFNVLSQRFSMRKLHTSTHLYTSDELIVDFPGTVYKVDHNLDYKKKSVCAVLDSKKINIKTYNFANSPKEVKKKLGLQDGGNAYLFAVKAMDDKYRILLTHKA